jgi:hypothetical protein
MPVDRDSMVHDWMIGGDCVELLIGGELWLVSDTDHCVFDAVLDTSIHTAIGHDGGQWICNHELFELVMELSPKESCREAELRMGC